MKRRFVSRKEPPAEDRPAAAAAPPGTGPRHAANRLASKLCKTFEQMCGFEGEDFASFDSFASAMYRPTDPASLGIARALFGLCMMIDVVEERGLAIVDLKWGDPSTCHFPLIHGLRPLGLPHMIILYALMWLGALGIMLGLYFKLACALFAIPYWYILLLDKSFWNNHSYLFGVVALLFWSTTANAYFSLDAKLGRCREKTVPFWNYFILRFQFFTLYFLAGLKKSGREWLEGYAMMDLSKHWVFEPFRLFLSSEQTDFYVVHWFAFIFDLTVGFFMLFDASRVPAMIFCSAFHLMNSRLFSIGMFPYVCLATMPLFCHVDWPRKLLANERPEKSGLAEEVDWCRGRNSDSQDNPAGYDGSRGKKDTRAESKVSTRQRLVVALLLSHVALQLFLPYSHFITQGYNNWVPGLYGYSWDMMMHKWDTAHIVVKVRDNESQKDYFLDPGAWTLNERWSKHGDMVRQFAHCAKDNVQRRQGHLTGAKGVRASLSSNLSIYVDVWCSLNGRIQQRLFDPNVDLLTVEWHPLKPISYVMPLLHQFSSYRSELDRIHSEVMSWSNYTDALFVADYPGLSLHNYMDAELTNVTLAVLEGEVAYQEEESDARPAPTIAKGGSVRIRTGRFHRVQTTSPHPACYMYTFANRTKQQLAERGITEAANIKPAFPILEEIRFKIDSFSLAVAHIVNAFLHLTYDVPMIRRLP